jgi:hypothetical protein
VYLRASVRDKKALDTSVHQLLDLAMRALSPLNLVCLRVASAMTDRPSSVPSRKIPIA